MFLAHIYKTTPNPISPHPHQVHIPGCGDFVVEDVKFLPDPCPLPDHEKKRSLLTEEQLVYAPFSGVGGVVYDKDAVYIELGGSQHGRYIMEQQKEQQLRLQREQTLHSSTVVSVGAGLLCVLNCVVCSGATVCGELCGV